MPLEILLVLVVGGIAGIAVLLHLTGRSRQVKLDAESARAAWLRHAPGTKIVDVQVAKNGSAALVRTRKSTGLVWAFGDDTVARFVRSPEFKETKNGLRIGFADFGAPSVTLTLTDEERRNWRHILRP